MPNARTYAHDETYAEWHRVASIARFMSMTEADSLWYIDADWIEACPSCGKTLLLVEAARDVGQVAKPSRILRELAKDAGKPAAVVFYQLADTRQPAPRDDLPDIAQFRVRKVWPEEREAVYTPQEWARVLLQLRRSHYDHCLRSAA